MALYQIGVTSYIEPTWQVGTYMVTPYLICLDCGRFWREIQEIAHQIKADHDPVCPAMLWQRKRFHARTHDWTTGAKLPTPVSGCICLCCQDPLMGCRCSGEPEPRQCECFYCQGMIACAV